MATESESIQKFDVNDAADKLKHKIRDAFMELLTPEQFRDMVHTELKKFTESRFVQGQYGREGYHEASEFSKVCRGVFEEYIKTELRALLDSPEYRTQWNGQGRMEISEAVEQWLTKHRRELIESTVMAFAGNAAQEMLQNLRSRV